MKNDSYIHFDWSLCCELAARNFGWNTRRPVGAALSKRGASLALRLFGNIQNENSTC